MRKDQSTSRVPRALVFVALWVSMLGSLCAEGGSGSIPSSDEVLGYYDTPSRTSVEVIGNVATVAVQQDAQQIRRGGALWAKVGPYIFLFSDETLQLFEDYDGLAGVRFVTRVGEADVASALLARDELSDVLWRRGINIAGLARRDGSSQPTRLEDLVDWGEAHTEFEYNTRFTRR